MSLGKCCHSRQCVDTVFMYTAVGAALQRCSCLCRACLGCPWPGPALCPSDRQCVHVNDTNLFGNSDSTFRTETLGIWDMGLG